MASIGSIDVIGKGFRSPFQFSVGRGIRSISASNGIDKIIASITSILRTRPGERLMQPEYGSRLGDLVFEPNDSILVRLLYYYTVEAIGRWERRIKITSIEFLKDPNNPHYIGILINFQELQTHEEGSFVFPFERGTMPMSQAVTGTETERIFTPGKVFPPTGIDV